MSAAVFVVNAFLLDILLVSKKGVGVFYLVPWCGCKLCVVATRGVSDSVMLVVYLTW